LDRIIVDPEKPIVPPAEYFGTENKNQWCYYFEKADLARQQAKWDEVVKLYDEAESKGYRPIIDDEWLPLLEALLNKKQYQSAWDITKNIKDLDQTNTAGFCNIWSRQKENNDNSSIVNDAIMFLRCKN
jgi:hypothetical protein